MIRLATIVVAMVVLAALPPTQTVMNPFTGKLDYVTRLDNYTTLARIGAGPTWNGGAWPGGGGPGATTWGSITGTLSTQTDLDVALNARLTTTTFTSYTTIERVPTTTTINGHALSSNVTLNASDTGAEPALGNPAVDGYILSSTTTGTRSWIVPPGGGGGTPASTVVTETGYGQTQAVGVSTNYAREDHTHGSPATTKDTTAVTGILKGSTGSIIAATVATDYSLINGTGYVKAAGTTLSYDNSTFATGGGTATNTNTGDVTLATNSGLAFTSGQTGLAVGTPSTVTSATTNSVTTATHTHAITASFGLLPNAAAQYYVPVSGTTPFAYGGVLATGTGSPVLATSPTLTTAVLGSSTATTQAQNINNTTLSTTAWSRLYTQPMYGTATVITLSGSPTCTGTLTPAVGVNLFTINPASCTTLALTGGTGIVGQEFALIITTSTTTSTVVTFSTNFKSTGTLTTGTTSGKVFVVKFIASATNKINEFARTTAM